jgi:hypothetical protein
MRLLRRVTICNRQLRSTDYSAVKLARFDFWRRSDLAISRPVASLPDEKNESRDQPNDNEHPVLTFETQKGEMLNEKLHRSRPLFGQNKRFSDQNILFLYFYYCLAASDCTQPPSGNIWQRYARPTPSALRAFRNYNRD